MNRLEIESKTREIIALQFDIKLDDLRLETDFISDLNADSLDTVEVIMMIEDRFDISVPDEEAINLLTVRAVVDYVEKKIADNSGK